MKFPDYPSNREADEGAISHCRKMGRRSGRMKLSRETCLHIDLLGMGVAIGGYGCG